MEIEKIEELLTSLITALEESGDISAAAVVPVMQWALLLHIYKKLDSIEALLDTLQPPT